MLNETDRIVVMCLVDKGYQWGTIWRCGLYERAYAITARLLACKGDVADATWPGMPADDLDLTMIIADWMQSVYKNRHV